MTEQAPEGWYPDPHDPQRLRWWDGGAWTEHVEEAAALPPLGVSDELPPAEGPLRAVADATSETHPTPHLDASGTGTGGQQRARRRTHLAVVGVVVLLLAGGAVFLLLDRMADGTLDTAAAATAHQDDEGADGREPAASDGKEALEIDADSFDPDAWLPTFHSEVHRLVVDGPRTGLLVFSLPEQADPRPVTASLFVEDRGTFELADQRELPCGYQASFHDDHGLVFLECPGGATAHFVWAVGRDDLHLQIHPEDHSDDNWGWLQYGWDRVAVADRPDDLVIWQRDCDPNCIEGGRIGTHLTYDSGFRKWSATGCTGPDGTRYEFDRPWNASASPGLDIFGGCHALVQASQPTANTAAFQLPSGNIACEVAVDEHGEHLLCVIASGLSPGPGGNACDWNALVLDAYRSAEYSCDLVSSNGLPVLGYGEMWTGAGITCSASEQGLDCWNDRGNGFFLSRSAWEIW
jgi:hypothetical protein